MQLTTMYINRRQHVFNLSLSVCSQSPPQRDSKFFDHKIKEVIN